MTALARSFFWWIGLDKDIEKLGKSSESCPAVTSNPTVAPLHPLVWSDAPWTRMRVDHPGLFLGKMFFVIVDAHAKWLANMHRWFSITAHNSFQMSLFTSFARMEL